MCTLDPIICTSDVAVAEMGVALEIPADFLAAVCVTTVCDGMVVLIAAVTAVAGIFDAIRVVELIVLLDETLIT